MKTSSSLRFSSLRLSFLRLSSHTFTFSVVVSLSTLALVMSPVSGWLESSLVGHMVIEFPLLIFAGVLLGVIFKRKIKRMPSVSNAVSQFNQGGIFGLLLASFLLTFWMIPRWLDASISSNIMGYLKYASLLVVGLCLSASWQKAHILVRAVIKIEFLTMLFRLGWLYLISPVRLCNNYLLGDQIWLGRAFLILAITLMIYWLVPIFFGNSQENVILEKDRLILNQN